MRQLPQRAQLYITAVVLSGGALFAISLGRTSFDRLPLLISLMFASALLARFKLRLPTTKNRSTLSVSYAVDCASLLLLGPDPTMLVAAAGAWSQSTFGVRNRNPTYRKLFNITSLGLTIQAGGLAYRLSGGTVGHVTWPDAATPLAAAALVHFLVSSGTVALAVALSTEQRAGHIWLHDFAWAAPSYFVGAGAAAVGAVVVDRSAFALIPLAIGPLYVMYRAYQSQIARFEDERRMREIIESLNEGMFVLGYDGSVQLWNDALERITGVSRQIALNQSLFKTIPVLQQTELPQAVGDALNGGPPLVLQQVHFQASAGPRILQVRLLPFAAGVTGFVSDITERTFAEEALRQSEERYALALAGANDGIWDWDLANRAIYFSDRWKAMLGFAPDEIGPGPEEWFGRVHTDDVDSLESAIAAHCSEQAAHFEYEHRVKHRDGSYRWVLCRGVAVKAADGRATRMAGSMTDVTERHAIQEQLRQAALHDALTALPNRVLFMELLDQALVRSARPGCPLFGVLFIDVDRFKVVNDGLGHLVGDQLLIAFTECLETCRRRGDVIARLGGDEFTILLNELRNPGEASQVAARIQEAVARPFQLGEHEVFVTVSIGVALSSTGYERAEDILRDADTAMYRAKGLGRARHEIFDVSMHAGAVNRLNLENDLRLGVSRKEFQLHYQPIVSLATDQLVGFEALLRWKRPDGRISMPGDFIPLAEEMGLLDGVGDWSLREACRQLSAWRAQFPAAAGFGMTVNVSSRQLMQTDFVEQVASAVRDARLSPDSLRLEITETALMESPAAAAKAFGRLRKMGVGLYLDDFGMGYSSLSYLHRFPVNNIKIDRSFISSLTERQEHPAIVESIIALARALGAGVIAEGVETSEQANQLRMMGCGYAQGFYFSKPLPPAAAERFMVPGVGHPRRWVAPDPSELGVNVH